MYSYYIKLKLIKYMKIQMIIPRQLYYIVKVSVPLSSSFDFQVFRFMRLTIILSLITS